MNIFVGCLLIIGQHNELLFARPKAAAMPEETEWSVLDSMTPEEKFSASSIRVKVYNASEYEERVVVDEAFCRRQLGGSNGLDRMTKSSNNLERMSKSVARAKKLSACSDQGKSTSPSREYKVGQNDH